MQRGEIYSARMRQTTGGARDRPRPVLIIQNDVGNELCQTIIVAGITSKASTRKYPVNVSIPDGLLPKTAVVRLNQILTVDRSQLGRKMASLSVDTMAEVDEALRVSLGLSRL